MPNIVECGHWCSSARYSYDGGPVWRVSPPPKGKHRKWATVCCLCWTSRQGMLKTDSDYIDLMRLLVEDCCPTCKGREPEHYAEAKSFVENFEDGFYDARIGEE
jgi:hypothetical protein